MACEDAECQEMFPEVKPETEIRERERLGQKLVSCPNKPITTMCLSALHERAAQA